MIIEKKLSKKKGKHYKTMKELISNTISPTNTRWFIRISMNNLKVKEEVEVVVEILEVAIEEDEVVAKMTLKNFKMIMKKLHKRKTKNLRSRSQK